MGLENHSWSGLSRGIFYTLSKAVFVALNSENVEKFPGWTVLYD